MDVDKAQQSIDLYTELFPRTTVAFILQFPPDVTKAATEGIDSEQFRWVESWSGLIVMAALEGDGMRLRINDSPIHQLFTFTSSLYFETSEQAEYQSVLFGRADGGLFL